ncbi:glutathione ABC transporter ATP-binding protein [Brachybacterium endophyticum]|uniref:Glutathione ABC transporter ATP-binding protein n=1 Tax=Brachybacterium endophyticum TaxID=2182385 RepID=A0A2U2RN67_9MICO|nr:ABC transporter ATP-binding protein [Brachybacterium endophyticum]PWH07310.1 glutathione ABC transporter ATP-binding protein [Brachybacterium endophyticum]
MSETLQHRADAGEGDGPVGRGEGGGRDGRGERGGREGGGPRLAIRDLDVTFATDAGEVHAVDGVSLEVAPGEILAVVGESGSGKSVTARSILGLLPETAEASGAVLVTGTDVVGLSGARLRALRGEDVSMIFQEPSSAMNPVFPIWWQIGEGLRAHQPKLTRKQIRAKAVEALTAVGIPDPSERIDRYPHEFSGGQKQRIMIAMALAMGAELIVADEPTTALDVTVQAEILDLLRDVRDRFDTSIIVITHNMGVVADLADTVAVMHRGRVIERAGVRDLFADPQQEYTRKLLAAVPHLGRRSAWSALSPERQQEIEGADPLVEAKDLVIEYPGRLGRPAFRAVHGVDLTIRRGEVFGLVGESGSGKTTIGRTIAGLEKATDGSLAVLGHQMLRFRERAFKPVRRRIGFVFQDPATSFNPHLTIEECIAEPLVVHDRGLSAAQRSTRVGELLESVELPADYRRRYPHELSGGQRQRVSLARALVLDPELLIADEPTSALDVSVQATVLDLFRELQERLGFAALFISHDLAVVDSLAHRIGVLYQGRLVEEGHGPDVLQAPKDPYTRRLIASLPVPDPVEQERRRAAYAEEFGRAVG